MKPKAKQKPKIEPLGMQWETYAFLKSLLEEAKKQLERDYRKSIDFIPPEPHRPKTISGRERAHRIFSDAYAKLCKMGDELHTAAAATYKDHPRREMREFWGLE